MVTAEMKKSEIGEDEIKKLGGFAGGRSGRAFSLVEGGGGRLGKKGKVGTGVFLGAGWRREIGEEGEGRGGDEREGGGAHRRGRRSCRRRSWGWPEMEMEMEKKEREVEELEMMVVHWSEGGGGGLRRRRRRLEDSGVAMMAEKNRGRGKEWRRSSQRRRWHGGVQRRWRLDSFPGLP